MQSGVVYNFGRVCWSLCQSITFKSFDVESSYLHFRYISREYGSSLYMKVIGSGLGQGHRSKMIENLYSCNVKLRSAILILSKV